MKKLVITGIMLIVTVAMVVTYAAVHALLSGQKSGGMMTVESIQSLRTEVDRPESSIFYKGAINPTVKVETGPLTQSQRNAQAR